VCLQRNAVEISSLRDLPIARPYVTPQGTALIRQNQREVVLGSTCIEREALDWRLCLSIVRARLFPEYMESRHGGVIFIVVPQTQAEEGCELGPTSSRRAMVPTCLPAPSPPCGLQYLTLGNIHIPMTLDDPR